MQTPKNLNPTTVYPRALSFKSLILGGSWDLVNRVISALIGVISSYKYSYPNYNPSY